MHAGEIGGGEDDKIDNNIVGNNNLIFSIVTQSIETIETDN